MKFPDVKLREVAHARAGDKGNISNISVIPYEPSDYAFLLDYLTAERVRAHFSDIVEGKVVRYEMPGLRVLNFVMYGALSGGVTRSLSLDAHGKSLSSSLLELEIPDQPCRRRSRGPALPGPEGRRN
jgi:hypothetical protein